MQRLEHPTSAAFAQQFQHNMLVEFKALTPAQKLLIRLIGSQPATLEQFLGEGSSVGTTPLQRGQLMECLFGQDLMLENGQIGRGWKRRRAFDRAQKAGSCFPLRTTPSSSAPKAKPAAWTNPGQVGAREKCWAADYPFKHRPSGTRLMSS